jgi:hypothetical protein
MTQSNLSLGRISDGELLISFNQTLPQSLLIGKFGSDRLCLSRQIDRSGTGVRARGLRTRVDDA